MTSTLARITLLSFLFLLFIPHFTSAEMKTFIKEYTYQASEDDSRNSSRTIAMREVKRLLLEELGTYLESVTEVQNFQLTKDQITTLTAGIVKTEIVDEKWDGRTYWLRAKIATDSGQVVKAIDTLRKDRVKSKELEKVRHRSEILLKENSILRKELATARGENRQKTAVAYNKTIKELTAIEWFESGFSYFTSGYYKEAIDACSKSIEQNPKDARAYSIRGLSHHSLANYHQAIMDFDQVIILDPKDADVFVARGLAYGTIGNSNQAIKDFSRAIKMKPRHEGAYVARGAVYLSLGHQKRAIEDFDRAIRLNPKDSGYYNIRGVAYLDIDYNRAMKDFNKAIELNPKYADAYFGRGTIYHLQGNRNRSIDEMKSAARLGNNMAQVFLRKQGIDW